MGQINLNNFKVITDKLNTFFVDNKFMVASEIPTTGDFKVGDIIINNGPTNIDEPMWICVEAGNPGTWTVFNSGGGSGGGKLTTARNRVVLNGESKSEVSIGVSGFNKASDVLMVFINSRFMTEGVDYEINADSTKIVAIGEVWNEELASEFEIEMIVFKMMGEEGVVSSVNEIVKLKNTVVVNEAVNEVEIGIDGFNKGDDLTVYRNSVYMIEGIDYGVQGNKIISLKGAWNAEGGSDYKFTFEVLKAVAKVNPDAVIGMDHLTEDVKEAIEAAGGSKLKGKTIVRFGDSITEDGAIVDETISALTGANIINVGVACARMTSDDSSQGYDGFSMTNLVLAYYNQKQGNENPWSYQESQNEITKGNGDDNTEILNRLKNIDFSQVDYVLISYGTNDFAGNVPLGGLYDSWRDETGKTFCGAVNFSVSMLLTMYPHLKIVFTSPTWRGRLYEDEITCDNAINSENLMLKHYVKSLKLLCEKNHVQFIDLFNIGINEFNHAQYLWDRLHFNETGAALLGEYIANGLLNSSPMNEAEMIIGDLNYLHTDDKTDLVAAINEVNVYAHDNIGDMENLQTTNKGNLVEAINELFYSGINAKQELVDALVSKGVDCSTSDSFSDLISNVSNMSGGGLDIISATELPATGKENQICVITDNPADIFRITPNVDYVSNDGNEIVVYTGTPYTSGLHSGYFLASGSDNNITEYYFDKIIQNSERKNSYIYINSTWEQMTKAHISWLENGIFMNSELFGGHTNNLWFTINSEGITFKPDTSFTTNVGIATTNRIDFTVYNKVSLKIKTNNLAGNLYLMAVDSISRLNNDSSETSLSNLTSYAGTKHQSKISLKANDTLYYDIDISGWSGNYYLAIVYSSSKVTGYNTNYNITVIDALVY